jgi:hypothetical protein
MVHSIVERAERAERRFEEVFDWLLSICALSFWRPGRLLDSEMAINDRFSECSISLLSRKM